MVEALALLAKRNSLPTTLVEHQTITCQGLSDAKAGEYVVVVYLSGHALQEAEALYQGCWGDKVHQVVVLSGTHPQSYKPDEYFWIIAKPAPFEVLRIICFEQMHQRP